MISAEWILVLLIQFKAKSFYDNHEQGYIVTGQWRLRVTISLITGNGGSWEEPHRPERNRKGRVRGWEGKIGEYWHTSTSLNMPSELPWYHEIRDKEGNLIPSTHPITRNSRQVFNICRVFLLLCVLSLPKCSSLYATTRAFQAASQGLLGKILMRQNAEQNSKQAFQVLANLKGAVPILKPVSYTVGYLKG